MNGDEALVDGRSNKLRSTEMIYTLPSFSLSKKKNQLGTIYQLMHCVRHRILYRNDTVRDNLLYLHHNNNSIINQ